MSYSLAVNLLHWIIGFASAFTVLAWWAYRRNTTISRLLDLKVRINRGLNWLDRTSLRSKKGVNRTCTLINYDVELRAIRARKARWEKAHPFGPLNPVDARQYDDICFEEAGTIILCAMETQGEYSADKVNAIIADTQDWR